MSDGRGFRRRHARCGMCDVYLERELLRVVLVEGNVVAHSVVEVGLLLKPALRYV